MVYETMDSSFDPVTSHKGCVSRNLLYLLDGSDYIVTSHKGCVSRNTEELEKQNRDFVTSHKGCVSRNDRLEQTYKNDLKSHPTRDV